MSFNDGKQLLVFGLSFTKHDNRKMQQLLRHYDKLPDNPGSRAHLFVQLDKVAKELMADEAAQQQIEKLTDWMTKGGDFPLSVAPPPPPISANPGNLPRPAQDTDFGHQPVNSLPVPFLTGRQGYHGPGRTLNGQHITANGPTLHGVPSGPPAPDLSRQYGRGRRVGDDWEDDGDDGEQNGVGGRRDDHSGEPSDDEAEEGQVYGREVMDTLMDEDEDGDEDEDMLFPTIPQPHHIGIFPRQRRRFGDFLPGPQQHTPFYGPGRTLNDPPEQDSEAVADEGGAAGGYVNVEGQDAAQPHTQPFALEPEHFNAAVRDLHTQLGLREPPQHHDGNTSTDSEDDLRNEYYEHGSSTRHGEPDDEEDIECPICLEDYPRSRFPKRHTITEFCDHPDKACLNCLDSSIAAVVERGALHLLACPICPQKLSRRDVKEYANRDVYKRYKYLKEQSEIPGHYISCTKPKCGGSQPHEGEDPKMVCNHCEFATCAKHRRPWHEGQTCREFDLDDAQIERLEEEEATAKLLSREATSICPKCGQGVTKSDGCDHMRCQCGQEWCYVCSCSYENIIRLGPTAHATFCTYHPNKVNLTKLQQDAARDRIMGLVHGGKVSAELARAREDLRRRRREEIRPKAAEAAETRMRLQQEQNKNEERGKKDGPPEKKKQKFKLVAPWEEGGRIE